MSLFAPTHEVTNSRYFQEEKGCLELLGFATTQLTKTGEKIQEFHELVFTISFNWKCTGRGTSQPSLANAWGMIVSKSYFLSEEKVNPQLLLVVFVDHMSVCFSPPPGSRIGE